LEGSLRPIVRAQRKERLLSPGPEGGGASKEKDGGSEDGHILEGEIPAEQKQTKKLSQPEARSKNKGGVTTTKSHARMGGVRPFLLRRQLAENRSRKGP